MANIAGRSAGRGTIAGRLPIAQAHIGRGRSPIALALTDLVRENLADVNLDTVLSEGARLDYDDFPDEDLTPDLGRFDDDDPFTEDPDERAAALPIRPEIFLWEGPTGIEWEIRPTSETLLADSDLARLAIRRERLLERYAVGLTAEILPPSVGQLASADLLGIWDAIPIRNPSDPFDTVRWNTQAAIVQRWGVDVSTLSRDRTVLVSLPSGHVLPFQFFTWKTENDVLVEAIAKAENVFSDSIRSVAETVTPQPRAQRTAKDYVPWIRATLRHPQIVRRARDQFLYAPARFEYILGHLRQALLDAEADRVQREGGACLGKENRSLPVIQRALVGGI